jgi:hypothetical protein
MMFVRAEGCLGVVRRATQTTCTVLKSLLIPRLTHCVRAEGELAVRKLNQVHIMHV